MSNQQKLLLESKSVGDFLLKQQKRNEWGAKQWEKKKQEYAEKRPEYAEQKKETVGNCSLLRRKKTGVKKVEPKLDAWDKFRLARWSLK